MGDQVGGIDPNFESRFGEMIEIGRGRHSRVYRAKDRLLKRWVAIKNIEATGNATQAAVESEIRILSKLNHPSIVRLYDAIRIKRSVSIVQSLCAQGNLANFDSLSRYELSQRTLWIATIADAVQHMHQSGFIHGDIKPANILLDGNTKPFLCDFSESREIGKPGTTDMIQIVGSTGYIAPEMLKETSGPTTASDIFALGVTLYELIARKPAFSGNAEHIMLQSTRGGVPLLTKSEGRFAADWNTIIQKATHPQPHLRYENVAALAEDIRSLNDFRPIRAKKPTRLSRIKLWAQRESRLARRIAMVLATVLALICITSIAWGISNWQLQRITSEEENLRVRIEQVAYAQNELTDQMQATKEATREALERESEASRESQKAFAAKTELERRIAERTRLTEESQRLTLSASNEAEIKARMDAEAKAAKEQILLESSQIRYDENRLKRETQEAIYWRKITEVKSAVSEMRWDLARKALFECDVRYRGLEYYLLEGLIKTERTTPTLRSIGDIVNVGAFRILPHKETSIFIDRTDEYEISRVDNQTGKRTKLGSLPNKIYGRESRGIQVNGRELIVFTGDPANYDKVYYSLFDVSGTGKMKQLAEGSINGYFHSAVYLSGNGWVAIRSDKSDGNRFSLYSIQKNQEIWSALFKKGSRASMRKVWCDESVICLAAYDDGTLFHVLHEDKEQRIQSKEVKVLSIVPWVFISPDHTNAYCPPPFEPYKKQISTVERLGFGSLLANRIHDRTENNQELEHISGLASPIWGAFQIPLGNWKMTKFEYLSNGKALSIGYRKNKKEMERKAFLIDFGIEPTEEFQQLMSKVSEERLVELLTNVSVEYDYGQAQTGKSGSNSSQ
jgi:serine/threonine protein kinase